MLIFPPNEEIIFTDNGVLPTELLQLPEGTFTWTSPSLTPAGTTIEFTLVPILSVGMSFVWSIPTRSMGTRKT